MRPVFRPVRRRPATPSPDDQPPRQRVAGAQGLELGLAKGEAVGRRPAFAPERDGAAVARQAVEIGAVKAGKAFELVECTGVVKRLGVHLDGSVRGVAACAAAGVLLKVRRVGRAVGPQKELGAAAGSGLHQRHAVRFALEHGQAVIVWAHTADKDRVAVVQQMVAAGVGDLKRVLTNVKTRGTWGEVQLAALLEQLLTADQFAANVATVPGSNERVDFAIRLPGKGDGAVVWLPIDAKFPIEDYQRLLDAQDRCDPQQVEEAARAIESRLKSEAKSIHEKYISPPHTTDFALLYLPIEGLYAEALRRPGLAETLQRDWRISLAGPTTLAAMLNSLQMGFRTLAIEQRSAEVWAVLGAVKTEFGKFGEALAHTRKKLDEASNSISKAETRTRQLTRKLKEVEALPVSESEQLIGITDFDGEDD